MWNHMRETFALDMAITFDRRWLLGIPGPLTFQCATLKSWEWPGVKAGATNLTCTVHCVDWFYNVIIVLSKL